MRFLGWRVWLQFMSVPCGKAGSSGWGSSSRSQLATGGEGMNHSVVSWMKAKNGSHSGSAPLRQQKSIQHSGP